MNNTLILEGLKNIKTEIQKESVPVLAKAICVQNSLIHKGRQASDIDDYLEKHLPWVKLTTDINVKFGYCWPVHDTTSRVNWLEEQIKKLEKQ